MKNKIKLLVSLVTYNNDPSLLSIVLKDLVNDKSFYISIFDNSSSKNIKEYAKKNSIFYTSSENIGFGAGHNKNIFSFLKNHDDVGYILILNPDLLLSSTDVHKLLTCLKKYPNCIVVSPLLLNRDKSVQNFVRVIPSCFDYIKRFFNINHVNYAEKLKNKMYVPFAHGACYLISTFNYIKFNGYDEDYFMYCEDLDLCKRIYESDKKVMVDANIKVVHFLNRGSRKSIFLFFSHMKSIIRYFLKWGFFNSYKIKQINKRFLKK